LTRKNLDALVHTHQAVDIHYKPETRHCAQNISWMMQRDGISP